MEAYFHKDPHIVEWIDQIKEKVLAVCLLSGLDSDAEFQRGCRIVTKVSAVLMELPTFPVEYLEDGLKQLVKQQLPDERAIKNFPTFQTTLDNMLREGIKRAIESNPLEDLTTHSFAIDLGKEGTGEGFDTDREEVRGSFEDLNLEESIPALGPIPVLDSEVREGASEEEAREIGAKGKDYDFAKLALTENCTILEREAVKQGLTVKMFKLHRSPVPEYADRLKYVLTYLFPNSTVNWNKKLSGETFLAQIEDILIYLCESESKQPFCSDEYSKEGWKVYVCTYEDLRFPRRLERGLRQIQRLTKKQQKDTTNCMIS